MPLLANCSSCKTTRRASHLRSDPSRRFDNSSYWLFFINRDLFFRNLQDPERRSAIHPSLILASLALATLLKSSSIELREAGHDRALHFRGLAEEALNAAYDAEDLDHTLAETALVGLLSR